MEVNTAHPVLALDTGQVLTLDDALGTRVLARAGTVWITEEGSAEDHILAAGQARIVGRGGRTLVQALEPACVALQ